MRAQYRLKVAAVALVTLAVPLVARAALDEKTYSPAFCKPSNRDSETDYEFVDGMLLNNHDEEFFVCPLVRDNHDASTTLRKVFVEAIEGPSNWIWDCTLSTLVEDEVARDGNGVNVVVDYVYKVGNLDLLGTGEPGFEQIVLEDITASDGNEGGYVLDCALGADVSLKQITVRED